MKFLKETHIDFMKYRKIAYTISLSIIVLGVVTFFLRGQANFGIDFTGGTLVRYKFAEVVDVGDIRNSLKETGLSESIIQSYDNGKGIIIRTAGERRKEVEEIIGKKFASLNPIIEEEITIGPIVGKLLQKQAIVAVVLSLLGILIYMAFRFQFIWGVSGVLCIFHDALFMVAIFALTKREISLSVIAAILTIIGYSINDTIVIFDRIRENMKLSKKQPLHDLINIAVNQTMSRTIITSFTVLLTVLAILFLGGSVIRDFAFAMAVGVLVGTYSTVYIAAPLLVELQKLFKIKAR